MSNTHITSLVLTENETFDELCGNIVILDSQDITAFSFTHDANFATAYYFEVSGASGTKEYAVRVQGTVPPGFGNSMMSIYATVGTSPTPNEYFSFNISWVEATSPPPSSTYQVPNIVGTTQPLAEAAITDALLTVGLISFDASSTVPAGEVITQTPNAGTFVSLGATVDFVVSTGDTGGGGGGGGGGGAISNTGGGGSLPGGATYGTGGSGNPVPTIGVDGVVPNIVGMQHVDAERAIREAGFEVGYVSLVDTTNMDTTNTYYAFTISGEPIEKVLFQSPAAGSPLELGSSVNFGVASGRNIVSAYTPNLTTAVDELNSSVQDFATIYDFWKRFHLVNFLDSSKLNMTFATGKNLLRQHDSILVDMYEEAIARLINRDDEHIHDKL